MPPSPTFSTYMVSVAVGVTAASPACADWEKTDAAISHASRKPDAAERHGAALPRPSATGHLPAPLIVILFPTVTIVATRKAPNSPRTGNRRPGAVRYSDEKVL